MSGVERTRDYLFDNIKLVLIFLVTAVHLFAAVKAEAGSNEVIELFMVTACSFHMPLFMFISGYFSKNLKKSRAKAGEILIMYLLVQLVFLVYGCVVQGKKLPSLTDFLAPGFSMWYLFSLFFYRFFLPETVKVRYVTVLFFVISIVVMGASQSGAEKAFVKLFANVFYFLIGYFVTGEQIQKLRSQKKWIYILMFAAGVGLIYWLLHWKIIGATTLRLMMLRSISVESAGFGGWGYLIYLGIALFAVYMSVAVIGMFPEKKLLCSFLGKNTSTIYIGQAFLYLEFGRYLRGLAEFPARRYLYGLALVLSVLCVCICGCTPLAKGLQNCIRFIGAKLTRKEDAVEI